MNYSIYRVSLDMHDTSSQVMLNVKQGDSARKIYISLTDGSRPYKISADCTARLRAKTSSGAILFNDCTIKDNVIEYTLTNETCKNVGIVECEVTLYGSDGLKITSARFSLIVEGVITSDNEIESTNEFTALDNALKETNNISVSVSKVNDTSTIFVTKKDGTTQTATVKDGANGTDGIGISSTTINADGELVITYTEGEPKNLGKIIGPQGAQGLQGEKGDKGDTGEVTLDYANNTYAGLITPTVQGADITLNDRGNYPLRNLKIFGHTEQPVAPTYSTDPNTGKTILNPTEIVTSPYARVFTEKYNENSGVIENTAIIDLPYELRGVPTTSGNVYSWNKREWPKGNYKDVNGQEWVSDVIDFEEGKLYRYVEKYVFSGENIDLITEKNGTAFYASAICGYALGANGGYCTHFLTTYTSSITNSLVMNLASGNQMYFNAPNLFTTFNELKDYLRAQDENGTPVTVYFAANKPIEEISLTEEELNAYRLATEDTSLVHFMNADGGGLEVTYGADTKKYIDNKFNKLATAIVANS